MNSKNLVFWLILSIYWCSGLSHEVDQTQNLRFDKYKTSQENVKSTYSVLTESISQALNSENVHETCSSDDINCLTMSSGDRLGLEAIKALHQQLDDDADGNVDQTETNDFLREELKYDSGYEKRQRVFHRNDDMHISVKELWEAWLRSEVHNWTVEQTSEWLTVCVELPQYVDNFKQHKVSGSVLPRLAVNNVHYLSVLGIKDPIHKQKIALKAMDVVLFGPPKDNQPHWKDLTLIILLIGGGIGLWYALQQNKKFKSHLHRMNRDMDSLQNAEKALEDLQKELEQARQAKENVATEKQNLEKKLQEAGADAIVIHSSTSDLEVSQLKAEIELLRNELQMAEVELKDKCWAPPPGLQQWLQLTYEIENKSYIKNKMSAERQLQQAREACEKLRKKRSSLVGAFVSTHGKSIDDVDRSIVEARTSLNEVTQELQERVHRWKNIEHLLGFNVMNNSGLQYLENCLYRNFSARIPFGLKARISSQDELDDETSSIYTQSPGYLDTGASYTWKEADSSGSEASKQDDEGPLEAKTNPYSNVHFILGGEVNTYSEESTFNKKASQMVAAGRSISNNNISGNGTKTSHIVRSQSQDVGPSEYVSSNPKSSHSESSLESNLKKTQKTIRMHPSTVEEDVCSTDSSVLEEEVKKRKRKLFSGFSKKNKGKID